MRKLKLWVMPALAWALMGADHCRFAGEPVTSDQINLRKVAGGFTRPVAVAFPNDRTGSYYLVEQRGVVKLVDAAGASRVALDWRTHVDDGGNEMGLLGLALHPQFLTNRRVFVNYTHTVRGQLKSRVAEVKARADGTLDGASEQTILEFDQPFSNHNGGHVAFGPDGMLYIGTGDGGSANDPQGNGQSLRTFLAKMLRIDVDHGAPYVVPADNPRWDDASAKREIWANGLRNPWRYSFDKVTGELWAGDVGQNASEEIDVVEKGKNYGWNTMEGTRCFRTANCSQAGLSLPVAEYPRSEGASVTGGYVYRGAEVPDLVGAYLYADYVSGNIWALRRENGRVTSNKKILPSGLNVSSFGEDSVGEMYLLDHTNGDVYRIAPPNRRAEAPFPRTLSETGCFASLAPLVPAAGVTPFRVSSELWSDGAVKQRFVYVPEGNAKIPFRAEGGFAVPEGTVFLKSFAIPEVGGSAPIETRVLVKKAGRYVGYTYRWNAEHTDAHLLSGAATQRTRIFDGRAVEEFDYYFPSQSDCTRCHNNATPGVLGFDREHLNFDDQIPALATAGIFEAGTVPRDVASLGYIPAITETSAAIDARARAYLHTQCAHCHTPENPGNQGDFDLRFATLLRDTKLCTAEPQNDMGIGGAKILKPGSPDQSLAWVRLHTLQKDVRMPPLATSRRDAGGSQLVRNWISGLATCI